MDLRYRHMCRYVEHAKKLGIFTYITSKQTKKKRFIIETLLLVHVKKMNHKFHLKMFAVLQDFQHQFSPCTCVCVWCMLVCFKL